MNIKFKRFVNQLGSFTLGVGLIAANGVFMLVQKQPNIKHTAPQLAEQQSAQSEDSSSSGDLSLLSQGLRELEAASASTVTALQLPDSSGYAKASLDDYRMLLKIDRKKAESAEKTSKDSGGVYYAQDNTEIYDPQPEPMNFTATRSVASEYFTVYDLISESYVTMNAHEMLCQIVYNEVGGSWDDDAIKAQAVAAYSHLRFSDSIDFTPTVGLKTGYPDRIESCVSAVEGQAVFYDGEIINAMYSASTAGYSIESERIFEVYYPYLRAVVSEYDNEDPNYGLEYKFTFDEMRAIIKDELGITLSDDVNKWFGMLDIYSRMYVGYVDIDGQQTITARRMQEIFDLKSQSFTVDIGDNSITIKTYGWGHGVGMSQWGACKYAEHGYTYDQILRHYYLNTTIGLSVESTKAVERGNSLNSPQPEQTTSSENTQSAADTTTSQSSSSSSSTESLSGEDLTSSDSAAN